MHIFCESKRTTYNVFYANTHKLSTHLYAHKEIKLKTLGYKKILPDSIKASLRINLCRALCVECYCSHSRWQQ